MTLLWTLNKEIEIKKKKSDTHVDLVLTLGSSWEPQVPTKHWKCSRSELKRAAEI